MNLTKFQIVNCIYWIYGHEQRLLYTDSCNVLDSVIYYLQELSNGNYLQIGNSEIYYIGEDNELHISKEFKSAVKRILEEDKILNMFGYISFDETNIPDQKEFLWWRSENEDYLNIILRDKVISNKTKLKIRDILRDKLRRQETLIKSTEIKD